MQNVFFRCPPTARTGSVNGVHGNRPRHPAAGTPEKHGPAGDDARDRVVAARLDLPVVEEKSVGDPAEPRDRLVVARRRSAPPKGFPKS